jgi:hypothetical protein
MVGLPPALGRICSTILNASLPPSVMGDAEAICKKIAALKLQA